MTERSARPRRRSLRVLVVEDEEDSRAIMVMTLQLAGHQVTHTDNGFDALIELTSSDHDLVILDIVMPGMTGLEVLERAQKAGVSLPPVLLVSAVADLQVFQVAVDAGATGYVVKPFLPSELVDKVDALTSAPVSDPS